jgi:rhodanese-related sulfurtransferase
MAADPLPEVDPAGARERVDAGAVVLDVREPDEWSAGHVSDSAWIPMTAIPARYGELPTDRAIVVVCRTGARSGRVTEALRGAGYDAVNLAGGLQAWIAAGLPLVADDGAPGSVV